MQRKRKVFIYINIIMIIATLIITTIGIIFGAGDGQVGTQIIGWGYFKPFTMDSNIFGALVSVVMVYFVTKKLKDPYYIIPKWAEALYLMGATGLTLTLITVVGFLGPMNVLEGGHYYTWFIHDMTFFHLLNPLIIIVSYTCLLKEYRFDHFRWLVGIIPTIIYSFIYLIMVVCLRRWNDFYNFTIGGHYQYSPIVLFIIIVITSLISFGLTCLHNKNIRR